MSQRKIKVPEPLMMVEVDKLSDLQPTDILVFSVLNNVTVVQGAKLHGFIKDMLARNGMYNRFIILSRDSMMLNVLRLEP